MCNWDAQLYFMLPVDNPCACCPATEASVASDGVDDILWGLPDGCTASGTIGGEGLLNKIVIRNHKLN